MRRSRQQTRPASSARATGDSATLNRQVLDSLSQSFMQGDFAALRRHVQACVPVLRASGDEHSAGFALMILGAATGTAVARLVIGADRTVRELQVAGVDIDVTSALSETTRTWLPRQSATTTFSAYGKPVSIRVPPADEVTDAPFPVFPPSA